MVITQAELGGDLLSVAENETLDFRKSPRWNQARKLVSEGAPVPVIAGEVLGCVSKTLVKLRKRMPLDALILEVLSPWGQPEHFLGECKHAYEYAELILGFRHSHHDAISIFMGLADTIVQMFFDQQRGWLDFSRDPSKFHALERLRRDVMFQMRPCLEALAQEQAALAMGKSNRDWTRLLSRESQGKILTLSLLEN